MFQVLSQDPASLDIFASAEMNIDVWDMDFSTSGLGAERKALDFDDWFSSISAPGSATPTTTDEESDEFSRNDETQLVSSTFLPHNQLGGTGPDVILRSSDSIHFFVHSSLLCSKAVANITSSGTEQGLPIFGVEDHSSVLNIILHTIYGMSCAQFNHDFSEIVQAVDRLPSYGVQPNQIITLSHPLYDLILSLSPLHSLPAYALAARHNMDSLAVACSSRLLSLPLDRLSDQTASSIGPVYLKRLFLLHQQRRQTLSEILFYQMRPHPPTSVCDCSDQQKVSRAWMLAAATFLFDSRIDISNQELQSTFGSLIPMIECGDCRRSVETKLKDIIVRWSTTKTTI